MSTQEAHHIIVKLHRKYIQFRLLEHICLSLSPTILLLGILHQLGAPSQIKIVAPALTAVACFILLYFYSGLRRSTTHQTVRYLHEHFPQLQYSADLLVEDNQNLSSLQSLQLEKVAAAFNGLLPHVRIPHRLGRASIVLTLSIALGLLMLAVDGSSLRNESRQRHAGPSVQAVNERPLPAAIKNISVTIQPPPYTNLKLVTQDYLNLEAPEQSTVKWSVSFTDTLQKVALVFAGKDTLMLRPDAGTYTAGLVLKESKFYQITWADQTGRHASDFYPIHIIPDEPPRINIENQEQFVRLSYSPAHQIDLRCSIADEYGLASASIIVTVSKGSGESVKFREQQLYFESPSRIAGTRVSATRKLDLRSLGMEPGDELYYYIEATDNRVPAANRSRTETYFVALQDTASQQLSVEGGLGVDLMPEYFRSQRQLIIDTEKLLRNKKGLDQHTFNATSNELGYDQKVLRLRYSQFLGEEFETEIGDAGLDTPESDQPVEEQFGHTHDTENEHNLVDEKAQPAHEHDEPKDPTKKEDPIEAFVHAHDDTEEATFFIQSIRSKLKAAVAVMWDAELHLRMYTPEKSLPYQYEALRLLKEISNDSRIYVHRTGFDPPPVKEDKRLTGDLSEITNSTATADADLRENFEPVAKAIVLLESWRRQAPPQIHGEDKSLLLSAGQVLAAEALENPSYLKGLSTLKAIIENEIEPTGRKAAIEFLIAQFNQLLPGELTYTPKQRSMHKLEKKFMEKLEEQQR